jgi:hypothetical protein
MPMTVRALFFALLVAAAPAYGAYACRDAAGRPYAAEAPPPECAAGDVRRLDRSGAERELLPSPEHRRDAAAADAKAQAQRRAEAALAREDQRLREAYPTVVALDEAERRDVAALAAVRRDAEERLRRLARQRGRLDEEREFYARELPAWLMRAFDDNARMADYARRVMQKQDDSIADTRARFARDRRRLLELFASQLNH